MRCCCPLVGVWQASRQCTGASMHRRQHARLSVHAPAAQCSAVMAVHYCKSTATQSHGQAALVHTVDGRARRRRGPTTTWRSGAGAGSWAACSACACSTCMRAPAPPKRTYRSMCFHHSAPCGWQRLRRAFDCASGLVWLWVNAGAQECRERLPRPLGALEAARWTAAAADGAMAAAAAAAAARLSARAWRRADGGGYGRPDRQPGPRQR
jgi:hypothetical protein